MQSEVNEQVRLSRAAVSKPAVPDTGLAKDTWLAVSAISAAVRSTVTVSEPTDTHSWVSCHSWAALVALVAILCPAAALVVATGADSWIPGFAWLTLFTGISNVPAGLISW